MDSEIGENKQKGIKAAAKKGSSVAAKADWATVRRVNEHSVIEKCQVRNIAQCPRKNTATVNNKQFVGVGCQTVLSSQGIFHKPVTKKKEELRTAKNLWDSNWHGQENLFGQVCTFFCSLLQKLRADPEVVFSMPNYVKSTEDDGVMYRGQIGMPSDRIAAHVGWNDWVYVRRWNTGSPVPPRESANENKDGAEDEFREGYLDSLMDKYFLDEVDNEHVAMQILCFVQLEGIELRMNVMGKLVGATGVYALCHGCTERRGHRIAYESNLIRRVEKDKIDTGKKNIKKMKKQFKLYLLPVEDFVEPCVCFPDMWPDWIDKKNGNLKWNSEGVHPDGEEHLVLIKPRYWKQVLVNKMRFNIPRFEAHERNEKEGAQKKKMAKKQAKKQNLPKKGKRKCSDHDDSDNDSVPINQLLKSK